MFTDRYIRSLTPRNAPYRVWEKGSDRGFNIQITSSGGKLFSLCYRFDDKRKFLSLGRYPETSLKDARKRLQIARQTIENGIDPRLQAELDKLEREKQEHDRKKEKLKGSVGQLFSMYCDQLEQDGKVSHKEARRVLERDALPVIGSDKKANEVEPYDIKFVLHKVIKRGSLIQANQLRAYMSAAFNYGIKHDNNPRNMKAKVLFFLKANPVLVVPKPEESQRVVDRALSGDEIHDLWFLLDESELSIQTNLALKLIIATGGQRVKEIAHAEWKEFDMDKRVWSIPARRTKNSRPHVVPLNSVAQSIIEQLQKISGGRKYLFPIQKPKTNKPMPITSLTKAVNRFCDREEFEPFTPRDIRRTCKTMFAEMGISKDIRDRIHNHALNDVASKHYDKYDYYQEKKIALDKWANRLLKIVEGKESSIIEFPSLG